MQIKSLKIIETHLASPISAVEVGDKDRCLKSFMDMPSNQSHPCQLTTTTCGSVWL